MFNPRKLRNLRSARRISARQVEEASQRIAIAKSDKRFYISNSWLTQLENSGSEPSIWKLFSLSVIYRTSFSDLISVYGVELSEVEKFQTIAVPDRTQVLSDTQKTEEPDLCAVQRRATTLSKTNSPGVLEPSHTVSGYIGLNDFTMHPMIRPGSTVKIDTTQIRVTKSIGASEFERPIYFIEIRDAFVCSWCELQGRELILIPHYCSPVPIRRFRVPNEAEVVGRVIAFETRCVDDDTRSLKTTMAQKTGT